MHAGVYFILALPQYRLHSLTRDIFSQYAWFKVEQSLNLSLIQEDEDINLDAKAEVVVIDLAGNINSYVYFDAIDAKKIFYNYAVYTACS